MLIPTLLGMWFSIPNTFVKNAGHISNKSVRKNLTNHNLARKKLKSGEDPQRSRAKFSKSESIFSYSAEWVRDIEI